MFYPKIHLSFHSFSLLCHSLSLLKSNTHFAADVRVGVVAFEGEVFVLEVEDALPFGVDAHGGQRPRLTRELQTHLLQVVLVDMRVAEGVDEVARLQAADLRHHHGQQSVAGDIERHAEEDVGAALVELATEPAFGRLYIVS